MNNIKIGILWGFIEILTFRKVLQYIYLVDYFVWGF